MRYLLILSFIVTCATAYGQSISGIITDSATGQRISGAWVTSAHSATSSNLIGEFTISVVKLRDTIKVKLQGYKLYKLLANDTTGNNVVIQLEQSTFQLKAVNITAKKNRVKDSISNRQMFAKDFNSKAPGLKDIIRPSVTNGLIPIVGVTISLSPLITAIAYKHSRAYKFKQVLLKDEQAKYISSRFSEAKVAQVTNLKDDSLLDFIDKFRPTITQVNKMSDYDLLTYIKLNLVKFKN